MACIESAKALKILLEYSLQFFPYDHLEAYLKTSQTPVLLCNLDVANLPELGGSNSDWKYTIKFKKDIPDDFFTERFAVYEGYPLAINYGRTCMYINIE